MKSQRDRSESSPLATFVSAIPVSCPISSVAATAIERDHGNWRESTVRIKLTRFRFVLPNYSVKQLLDAIP